MDTDFDVRSRTGLRHLPQLLLAVHETLISVRYSRTLTYRLVEVIARVIERKGDHIFVGDGICSGVLERHVAGRECLLTLQMSAVKLESCRLLPRV